MSEPDPYVLGYLRAEQERLQQQALDLAHESHHLLDQVGLAAGARAVEIGCGPHGCLELLASRVGPSGRVVGVERSEEAVQMARRMVEDRALANVQILCGDARATGLPRESFDLATARLVLVNIPEPQQIVDEAVALVKPGGWVAFHEADWIAHVCDPPSHAWTTLVELFVTYSKRNGIDPFIGRKLPRLLRHSGLLDVHVTPIIHTYPAGHTRRSILLDFTNNVTERLLAQGLAQERELADLKAALRCHLDDPGTLVVSHLYFQAWGRKPS